jgi:hypothetical protein
MYFDDFNFCFFVLSKVDCKILVLFGLIQNFKILDLAMAKVKKVTYSFPLIENYAG